MFAAKVAAARSVARLSRLAGAGGGTTLPGRVLLALAPDGIERLAAGLAGGTVVISATNGKTTTAKMLAGMLPPGLAVCHNRAGANLASGVASALVTAPPDASVGVFEVDEAALPSVAGELEPSVLVLGNLFRDQLDRYGELERVGEGWSALVAGSPADRMLVRNGDDPLLGDLEARPGRTLTFGIADPAAALDEMPHAADSKWCRRCGQRLRYDAVFLGHLGDWWCPDCDVRRPPLDVAAAAIELDGLDGTAFELRTPLGRARVRLPVPGVYNVYNALAAAAAACAMGTVPPARIAAGLESFEPAFGRGERIRSAPRTCVTAPGQEPGGRQRGDPNARPRPPPEAAADRAQRPDRRRPRRVLDLGCRLRRAGPQQDEIVTTGTRAAEMALRLKHAGAEEHRMTVVPESGMPSPRRRPAGAGVRARDLHGHARPARQARGARHRPPLLGGGVTDLLVAHLYPEHLNIYADRGNMIVLRERCRRREIGFELLACGLYDSLPDADLYYLGGGQDRDQALIAADLRRRAGALQEAAGSGATVLGVCGGYQMLGHGYRGHHGDDLPGVGLVDLVTEAGPDRMIGNIAVRCLLDGVETVVVGFENHAGRTRLGDGVSPLGEVLHGYGNNGSDHGEGVLEGNVIGTYIHGPLLPKNPDFADWLIRRSLRRRHGEVELAPLDDKLEQEARRVALEITAG